jgi:hypothetical protein
MSCNKNRNEIYKEDDYRAFGGRLITINAVFPPEMLDGHTISKAELRCGDLLFTFDNPEFPIEVIPTAEQTAIMKHINTCFLKVYDENGYGITCNGQLQFVANDKVV